MLEWKQVDSLPYAIPCNWHPRLKLEKAIGCRLFRLRLAARQPGEDLIVRVRRGDFKALRRNSIDYHSLVPIVDDLKAIATKLRMTPISEQKKLKLPNQDLNWIEASGSLQFYGTPQLEDVYRYWWDYAVPSQWRITGQWTTSGDVTFDVVDNTVVDPPETDPPTNQVQEPQQ